MRYKGKVYRPPSEAYSLIVQVTYGCSHNRCAFCDMYDDKHFAMRPMEEIREDFEMARRVYRHVDRVFLADGDALMRKTDDLVQILGLVYGLFPECERVTCYASPTSLQIKSEEDLRLLREKGLKMVYMGLESGCDAVLERMNKGHTTAEIIAAGQKARRSGLQLSVTAISGLGSRELWREHAVETARAFNAMNPEYIGLLTLMVEPGTPLEKWVREDHPDALIVRLPALYGIHLKKNFLYDLHTITPAMLREEKYRELAARCELVEKGYSPAENGFYKLNGSVSGTALREWFEAQSFNALAFTDSRSLYQFYDLGRLWGDI